MAIVHTDKIEQQRRYVEEHKGCNHMIACAITEEDKKRAMEVLRTGNPVDAGIAAAALSGPCLHKGS